MAEKEKFSERLYRSFQNRLQGDEFGNTRDKISSLSHSSFYHKYFQGYTEVLVRNAKGHGKIERRYTAPWQQHCLTNQQWVITKVAYFVLYVFSAAAFISGLLQNIVSNYSVVVALPGLVTAISMVLTFAAVALYAATPRRMTLWEHHSSTEKLKIFSLISSVGLALTALAKILFVCIYLKGDFKGEVCSLLLVLLSAGLMLTLHFMERHIKYESVPNETPEIVGGCEIW